MGEMMAEKTCPQCAETVKAEAKICRFCQYNFETGRGSDVKVAPLPPEAKKNGKKAGIGCAILLVAIIVIIAVAGGKDEGAKSGGQAAGPTQPARQVTAVELARAFEANEAAAKKEYGDQPLKVTGTVDSVNLGIGDEAFVVLKGANMFSGPQVHFADNANDAAANLTKGQSLTVTCKDVSEVVGTAMLSECKM